MPNTSRLPSAFLLAAIIIGTLAGLAAARYRLHAEAANKRVEIGLEWDEVSRLAQFSHQPIEALLNRFKHVDVTSLVIQEDTFTTLEQDGLVHPTRAALPNGHYVTQLDGLNASLYNRIRAELKLRGIAEISDAQAGDLSETTRFTRATFDVGRPAAAPSFTVPIDYSNLRTIGVGLPLEATSAAAAAHLQVAGRIGNFPGVTPITARNVLNELADEGVSVVIFNGEEVLGYRDMEPQVAEMLKDGVLPVREPNAAGATAGPTRYLADGDIEFGKQKGAEKLAVKLNGDVIRVHSIQAGEMGQLDREEAIDRFAKASRERNIRFCYVRLLTYAGADPVGENIKFLNSIARGIHRGSAITGGDLQFGPAKRYLDPQTPRLLFPLLGVGVAAGTIWMLTLLLPLGERPQRILLIALGVLLALLAAAGGEFGRKILALLAGISYPAAACLYTYPTADQNERVTLAISKRACKAIVVASGITAIGIVHVVGLLASRPYMVHINQYLGIKLQHAVPFLIVLVAALFGGPVLAGEKLARFRDRAATSLRSALSEPARFGTLAFGVITLAILVLIIARTGNDAGVGVSGIELKARAILDRVMPVRPRTKEFLIGHPAYILGICWWLRGRRKLALPAFVIGSLGQVSLLNTFCHIHTPLVVSAWRGGTGLVVGTAIGLALFTIYERIAGEPGSGH